MSEYGKIHTDGSRSGGQPLDDSIEAKAAALLDAIQIERGFEPYEYFQRGYTHNEAICRAIEQHEAFKQEVSDAVEAYLNPNNRIYSHSLNRFVIPKPKPDPLADALADTFGASLIDADELRAALEARGLEIREKGQ
jgi:hypothetical protein